MAPVDALVTRVKRGSKAGGGTGGGGGAGSAECWIDLVSGSGRPVDGLTAVSGTGGDGSGSFSDIAVMMTRFWTEVARVRCLAAEAGCADDVLTCHLCSSKAYLQPISAIGTCLGIIHCPSIKGRARVESRLLSATSG